MRIRLRIGNEIYFFGAIVQFLLSIFANSKTIFYIFAVYWLVLSIEAEITRGRKK